MNLTETSLPGVWLIEPTLHQDQRGYFFEGWKQSAYHEGGIDLSFVQFNVSTSIRGVLRGLHYQHPQGQGKLVSVLSGSVFDVAVDIRPDSPTYRRWEGFLLDEQNHRQVYIPPGYAHGFLVLSDKAMVNYFCTAEYHAPSDGSIAWNDPDIGIDWPQQPLSLSGKDAAAPRLADLPAERLPRLEG